ncbi:hypothetical protein [Methanolobus halotolerans]|nr:hypothetical protein [Methanolobus halotolerans]
MKYDCFTDLAQLEKDMSIYISIMHGIKSNMYTKSTNNAHALH